jgi:hypothetical protein
MLLWFVAVRTDFMWKEKNEQREIDLSGTLKYQSLQVGF